jgi:hypothetical protein
MAAPAPWVRVAWEASSMASSMPTLMARMAALTKRWPLPQMWLRARSTVPPARASSMTDRSRWSK